MTDYRGTELNRPAPEVLPLYIRFLCLSVFVSHNMETVYQTHMTIYDIDNVCLFIKLIALDNNSGGKYIENHISM